MNAVIETLESIEPALEKRAVREVLQSGKPVLDNGPAVARSPLRQVRRRWQCNLSDQDLQCLLQIIEVDLIPQVLNSYSPARHVPDERLASG